MRSCSQVAVEKSGCGSLLTYGDFKPGEPQNRRSLDRRIRDLSTHGGRLAVEIKVVERLHFVYKAQVITYLKISDCPAGLILNFNAPSIREGLQRVDRPDLYAKRLAAKRAQSGL